MAVHRYQRTIEYTYDSEARASSIYLTEVGPGGRGSTRLTDEAFGSMYLHFDHDRRLASIELLSPELYLPDWEFRHTWDSVPPAEPRAPSSRWKRWVQRWFPPDPPRPRSVRRPIERTVELSCDDEADTVYLPLSRIATVPERSGFVDQHGDEPAIRLDFAERAVLGMEVSEASRSLAKRMLPDGA